MLKLTQEADKVCFAKVKEAGQEHLFDAWSDLTVDQQRALLGEIQKIDFQLLKRLVHETVDGLRPAAPAAGMVQPALAPQLPSESAQRGEYELCRTLGEYALRNRELLLVTAAGGGPCAQLDQPLGLLPIGPISGKSLLQLHAEKIQAMNRRYRTSLRWTIVCHPSERESLALYFRTQGYFGLSPADVSLCDQDLLPLVDRRGRIVVQGPGKMALEPTGHGGVLHRLLEQGRLEAMESAGIRHILYFQLDNPLCRLCDPIFLGHHIQSRSDVTTKVVRKERPDERVGVFGSSQGTLRVVEHTELNDEDRERRLPDGSLAFWAANTGMHLFSLELLCRLRDAGAELPYHRLEKATPCLGRGGKLVRPTQPNSSRFVAYAFDAIPLAERAVLVEVERQAEFSPIKRQRGPEDSLETARRDIAALHRRWLVQVAPGLELDAETPVEISPLFAQGPEELAERIELPLAEPEGGWLLGGRTQ